MPNIKSRMPGASGFLYINALACFGIGNVRLCQKFFTCGEDRVVAQWIMMDQQQPFCTAQHHELHAQCGACVAESRLLYQFILRVLRVKKQQIRVLGKVNEPCKRPCLILIW